MPNVVIDLNDHPTWEPPYHGPTVAEYCEMKVGEIDRTLANLKDHRHRFDKLWELHVGSKMLWAEYAATACEPYQVKQL